MADIKVVVAVVAALLVGAVIGGLIGHFAVPSTDPGNAKLMKCLEEVKLEGLEKRIGILEGDCMEKDGAIRRLSEQLQHQSQNVPTMVPKKAQCVLQEASAGGSVAGTLMFERLEDEMDSIMITGAVSGLSAGKHGFHVHQVGSTADGCKAAKGHFNPFGKDHGAPTAAVRHVGDLGNIEADATQTANVNIKDSMIKFAGDANILGRAIVIHAGEDDLGLGGETDSKTTGHAGARLACCVIGAL